MPAAQDKLVQERREMYAGKYKIVLSGYLVP